MLKTKNCVFFLITIFFVLNTAVAQNSKSIKTIIVDAGHGGKDYGAHGAYEGGLGSYEKNITLAISTKVLAELKKELPSVKIVPTRTTDIYQDVHEKANIANENKGDLFICIHADAVALKTGRRQISTRVETRYRYTYKGKGKKRKKIPHPYSTVVPVYQYYKIGSSRSGTSVWLFAAHKTGAKTDAILKNEAANIEDEIEIGSGEDSVLNAIDFSGPEYRMMAQVHAARYQQKSVKLATFINEEIDQTDRAALGINQRAKGIWVLQATNMPAILVETGFITNHNDERYLNSEKGQQEIAECIVRAVKRYKEELESNKGNSNGTNTDKDTMNTQEKKVLEEATGNNKPTQRTPKKAKK